MKTFYTRLLCIIAFLCTDCKKAEKHQGNFGQSPELIILPSRTSPPNLYLQSQFEGAHALSDSIVKLVLGDTTGYSSLITDYGFSYPNWEKHVGDTLTGPAQQYTFYYGLLHNRDTIKSAIISIGADMRVNSNEVYELIAYKKFLDGELTLGPTEAITRATAFGIKSNGASITFHSTNNAFDTLANIKQINVLYQHALTSPGRFYWKISNECDGCVVLKLDAATGEVFGKGTVNIMY